jgi:hypothetical protein
VYKIAPRQRDGKTNDTPNCYDKRKMPFPSQNRVAVEVEKRKDFASGASTRE